MKRYIKCADTLDGLISVIRNRLLVEGVKDVLIQSINSRYASVKLVYDDGSASKTFTVRFKNKPTRKDAETQWNPKWSVKDDGSVVDEDGSVVGWFKLAKRHPQATSSNYQENSLVVNYGTRSIELTDASGDAVADAVRKHTNRE